MNTYISNTSRPGLSREERYVSVAFMNLCSCLM